MKSALPPAVALVALALLGGGCRPPKRKPAPPPVQSAPVLPKEVNTQGIRINWRTKQSNGKLWRLLDVNAERGTVESDSQSGVMKNADGILYRENRPRAAFNAPTVTAARDQKSVIATGGVKVRSVDPPGVVLTADKATWYFEKNLVIAEGHVTMEQRDPKTHRRLAWGNAEHLTIDTELQRFSIP